MPDARVERFDAPDGTKLGYHILGDGPPVVCVPGGPGRASVYLEDLAGLSDTHSLVKFDLRGTGISELPADRDSLAFPRLAEDVELLREQRNLDRMDLLGHSAGCIVAMTYAARHPERISRLVLVTPSAHLFGDVSDDLEAIRRSRSGESWYPDAAAAQAELELLPPHRRNRPTPELRMFAYGRWDERCQEHAASTDSQMSLRATAAFGAGADFDVDALRTGLSKLTAPVLVVVGGRDGLTGVRAGYLVADLMPNSRVVEIPAAGHFPWVDEPEQFRSALGDFLD
ncbi:MAG: alpha/beta hydrolase [Frankiaceae bacterium]|nr:alpha/beta hydrolase [Frankiaceae bacterium]MBV9870962.1 alpha/beta hydrolase [Frankiaceae bacterium]